MDNSQAVVECPRDEGAQSLSDEGDDDPRAKGAETAEAEDDKPQWCDTGQMKNGCLMEEKVKIEGQKEEEEEEEKERKKIPTSQGNRWWEWWKKRGKRHQGIFSPRK